MINRGSWWRGRDLPWNPDRQRIEEERQRWVYEQISGMNNVITDLNTDPDKAYADHIEAYITTGDLQQLMFALEYVR